jgi:ribonuclease D
VKTILRELVLLRRELAQADDQPQRTILSDGALMELVRRKPDNASALAEIRFVPQPVAQRHGQRIVDCIRAAKSMPPIREEFARLLEDTAVRVRIDAMWLAFQTRCMATNIAPNLVTSRAEFTSWLAARIDREHKLAKGLPVESAPLPFTVDDWRAESIGRWLSDFIDGRCELSLRWDAESGGLRLGATT